MNDLVASPLRLAMRAIRLSLVAGLCVASPAPAPEPPPIDGQELDCAQIEERLPSLWNGAERRARADVERRMERAFLARSGRLGISSGGQAGPGAFWAGTGRPAPTFEVVGSDRPTGHSKGSWDPDTEGIELQLRPRGCAVYGLDDGSDTIRWVRGAFDVEIRSDQITLHITTRPFRFFPSGEVPDGHLMKWLLLVMRSEITDAMRERLATSPAGSERLALLRLAEKLLEVPFRGKLREAFEPIEAERHFVEFGDPSDFRVDGKTTIIGTMPMSVTLDGQAQSLEALPRSNPRSGQQYGRVVLDGQGLARLTIRTPTPSVDRTDVIFAFGPNTWADFTNWSSDMSMVGRPWFSRVREACVFAPYAVESHCEVAKPGEPAFPNDATCCRGHSHHPLDPKPEELQAVDSEVPPLRFMLLRPVAIELGPDPTRPSFRETTRSCKDTDSP